MYNLSLRMLMYPADAEDAVQEILIKIITHLSDFRGKSRFTTWSYRVAVKPSFDDADLSGQRAEYFF